MAEELLPKAASVALLMNSARPKDDGYSKQRVGSALILFFICPMNGDT